MSARRIVARPPRSQRSRRQRPGRLAPVNGSVTRADIEAIYAEFAALGSGTADEFRLYLVRAIQDWSPSPRQSARMSARARAREAARRAERRAREQLAQPPSRALAAA